MRSDRLGKNTLSHRFPPRFFPALFRGAVRSSAAMSHITQNSQDNRALGGPPAASPSSLSGLNFGCGGGGGGGLALAVTEVGDPP